jgi:AraC-like DNA-binding protein
MIWPNQKNLYKADTNEPWEYIWVTFNGILARDFMMQAGLDYNEPIYIDRSPADREKMVAILEQILSNGHQPPLYLMGYFYLFMNALIMSSGKRDLTYVGSMRNFYVRKAVSYINDHFHENLTIQDIADHCSVHRSYLSRIFKEALQVAPLQYLINCRIKKACELLASGEYAIGDVSTLVGYPNQQNFSRAFKRETGYAPLQWRARKQ